MSHPRWDTTPRQLPSEMDDTKRKPRRVVTITCSSPSNPKHVAAPLPRLTRPEMIAASCSALARFRLLDIAISSPSEDTATASVTPAVFSTKPLRSQLKLRASSLSVGLFIEHPPGARSHRPRHPLAHGPRRSGS